MRRSLVAFAILLAGCAGGTSDPPVLTFADFASPPTTTEVLADSSNPASSLDSAGSIDRGGDSSTTSTLGPSETTTTTSTTLIVVDVASPVAIRTDAGLSILEGRGAPRRLVEVPVAAGFEDLEGGFVFQLPGAGIDPDADQRIFWSRAAKPDAQPFLDVDEGSLLKLWGTAEIGDARSMILTITDAPDDPGSREERLIVYRFGAGDQVLGEVGGDGFGPRSISYGGGRFLLEQQAGEQTLFEFRNDQGAVLSLASNPQPGCVDDPTCPRFPALDATGSFVAYIQYEAEGGDAELVVLDLDLDEELRRIPLPGSLGEVTSVAFSDTTVLVNRIDPDGVERALVVNVSGSTVGEYGLTGHVQFLREVPAFDGVVDILVG